MLGSNEYMRNYGAAAPDLRPEFFMDTVKNAGASIEAGRDLYTEIERVRIIIPGAIATVCVKNVSDVERQRWPEHYRLFKAGQEAPLDGLPLEEWPVLNKAQVAELKYFKLRTVEDLARLPDVQLQPILGGLVLRQRARAYLDDAEHEAQTTRLLQRNDILETEVSVLKRQNEELGRQLLALTRRVNALDDARPDFQTYVPGDHDPFELARQQQDERRPYQGVLTNPVPAASALAELTARPERQRRGLIRYDDEEGGTPGLALEEGTP